MPVSVVVGGQFGSEGKGKVALEIARKASADYVVRVGGTNSGHTGCDDQGNIRALRQLPASAMAKGTTAIIPAGSLVDVDILTHEIEILQLDHSQVMIDPRAWVISDEDKRAETDLVSRIGSTGSGTGAALIRRIQRQEASSLAQNCKRLLPFLHDTSSIMRRALNQNKRIVIEGTQGFGLSLLHSSFYPKTTSRDTTAASFIGEAGLSPRDVDDVTLVIRAHPIRVAGDSGPLDEEISWGEIAKNSGLPGDYCELTTATKKVRRVGKFNAALVKQAIEVNNPSRLVLNHFDYVDRGVRQHRFNEASIAFLTQIEHSIERRIDWVGTGPTRFVDRALVGASTNLSVKMNRPA
ncbi:MAG: adenylosuccinate synthetase [Pseudolabrys sp.]|nr:adenylosuccinate synthetase [Pseudolabrys sp.]